MSDGLVGSVLFSWGCVALCWYGCKTIMPEAKIFQNEYRETSGFYYWYDDKTDVCMVSSTWMAYGDKIKTECTDQIKNLFLDRLEKEYAEYRLELAEKNCKKSPTCTNVYLKDNTVFYQQKGFEDFSEHDLKEAEDILSAHGL